MEKKLSPGIYRHLKRKDCFVFGEFVHTETNEVLVAYYLLTHPFDLRIAAAESFKDDPEHASYDHERQPTSVTKPGIYLHFKGKEYYVLGEFVHALTGERFVAYRAMYAPYASCARPLKMFSEDVDRPDHSYKGQRFRLVCAF